MTVTITDGHRREDRQDAVALAGGRQARQPRRALLAEKVDRSPQWGQRWVAKHPSAGSQSNANR